MACLPCDGSCLNSPKLPFGVGQSMGCPRTLARRRSIPSLLHILGSLWSLLSPPFSSFCLLPFIFLFAMLLLPSGFTVLFTP